MSNKNLYNCLLLSRRRLCTATLPESDGWHNAAEPFLLIRRDGSELPPDKEGLIIVTFGIHDLTMAMIKVQPNPRKSVPVKGSVGRAMGGGSASGGGGGGDDEDPIKDPLPPVNPVAEPFTPPSDEEEDDQMLELYGEFGAHVWKKRMTTVEVNNVKRYKIYKNKIVQKLYPNKQHYFFPNASLLDRRAENITTTSRQAH